MYKINTIVLPLEIQLSRWVGWYSLNRFSTATF